MPFIAECLHCRGSRFKVPNRKRGTFGHCPKCNQDFLLEPKSDASRELVNYRFDPTEDDDAINSSASLPYVEELPFDTTEIKAATNSSTASLPYLEDPPPATQPSGAIDATTPTQVPTVVESPRVVSRDEPTQPAYVGALVALGLFGFAILVSQLPYGRFIAGPFAVLGLSLAAISWLGLEKQKWLGPLAFGLNLLGLLLITVFPAWLGLSGWTPNQDPESTEKPVTAVGRDGSMPQVAEVVDASKAVWQQGDVRIAVITAKIGPLDPAAKMPEKLKERVLRITLTFTNVGVARAIKLAGWPTTDEPKLSQSGRVLAFRSASGTGGMLFPGKVVECELLFAIPGGSEELQLELPAVGYEGTDAAKFSIPRAFVTGR